MSIDQLTMSSFLYLPTQKDIVTALATAREEATISGARNVVLEKEAQRPYSDEVLRSTSCPLHKRRCRRRQCLPFH